MEPIDIEIKIKINGRDIEKKQCKIEQLSADFEQKIERIEKLSNLILEKIEQKPGIVEQKIVIPRSRTDKWTTDEDQVLYKNYIKKSVRKIVEENLLPGRNANAIYSRLNALNLTKYKDRKPKKIKNANKNFNQKILSRQYHDFVYEQCFNFLIFRLEQKETFRNKDIRKLIKEWYKDVLNQFIPDTVIHNYENSYLLYGLDQGFFEKIKMGHFKIPKIAKTIEEPKTTREESVRGFTEHKNMRIKEIRENEKKFLKEHKQLMEEEPNEDKIN
jgi:hypothetical protein